uniref:tRNA (adenosine(37)-N6)-threonylcarbamoyltransferase complex ATPase subunit type 1 TsaE n=1 Tax=Pararhizobium sp. IMCC3301 TaxID=3067904 RepID=UPI002740707F|nr:tRNA (adenosine(37)-N6)-threonylcarbamoyltransferase complex ATPase subunit type 1 TsaE [Pararhizobium sp. IMCC3301]
MAVPKPIQLFAAHLSDEAAMVRFAQDIAAAILPGDMIALEGDLGAGKTAFCRALIRSLAGDDDLEVPSPTFSLLQPYDLTIPVRHFDLYRLADPEDLDEIGFFDAQELALTLVEWPSRAADTLPHHHMLLSIEILQGEQRYLRFSLQPEQKDRFARTFAARKFLETSNYVEARRSHIQGDASHRSYERIFAPGKAAAVLMNAPETPPGEIIANGKTYAELVHRAADTPPFAAIDTALLKLGFSAPAIFAADHTSGFLLLEDFGKQGIIDSKGQPIRARYLAAVDVLAALHDRAADLSQSVEGVSEPYLIPAFDRTAFLTEVALFADWFVPHQQGSLSTAHHQDFMAVWSGLFEELAEAETGIILRDVHSPNLMWLQRANPLQTVGLLDFQDALWGPQLYDLASLVYDARIDIDPGFRQDMLARYQNVRTTALIPSDLDRHLTILAAQRTMKILGIFARLAMRDAKLSYLAHMPRNQNYLRQLLDNSALVALRRWYELCLGTPSGK